MVAYLFINCQFDIMKFLLNFSGVLLPLIFVVLGVKQSNNYLMIGGGVLFGLALGSVLEKVKKMGKKSDIPDGF